MKLRNFFLLFPLGLLLAGCGNLQKGITTINEGETTTGGNITTGRVDNSVYQGVITDGQYQTNAARGLTASRMNNGYNQENFENGLLRLSKEIFSVDTYYFQEGQKIEKATIEKWLGKKTEDNPLGLNQSGDAPIIFQQLLEYDFLKEDGKTLGGLSLGFAFNSVYYGENGAVSISKEEMMETANQAVNTVLTNVRSIAGLEEIPIVIGLFQQSPKDDIAGGSYIYYTVSQNGQTTVDSFEAVNEAYVVLPVADGQTNEATDDGLDNKFKTFQTAIYNFFPDLTGVSGKAYYVDGQVQKITVSIASNYYSQTEIISFSQFVSKQVESVFADVPGAIEVQLRSLSGQQAFVYREGSDGEVTAYQFD